MTDVSELTADLDVSTAFLDAMPYVKLRPADWLQFHSQYSTLVIYDPDGWDRANFEESWHEPITKDEMAKRVSQSTVLFNRT